MHRKRIQIKTVVWLSMFLVILLFVSYLCFRPEIDHDIMVGKYSGEYRGHVFQLELHQNDTYSYYCVKNDGTEVSCKGSWELCEEENGCPEIMFDPFAIVMGDGALSEPGYSYHDVKRNVFGKIIIPIEVDSPMYFIKQKEYK